jgi:hypothetical protein
MHQDVHIYYFTERFLTFERFFVDLFFDGFFIVIYSLDNFLLEDLKKIEETFLNFASLKVSYL